jgi:hypothetical protein
LSQQINLLGQVQAAPALSAKRALIGLGMMFALFLGYGVFAWFATARLAETAEQGNSQLAAEKAKLKTLEQKIAARPKLADIVAEIAALKAQAAESQQILNRAARRRGQQRGLFRLFHDPRAGYGGRRLADRGQDRKCRQNRHYCGSLTTAGIGVAVCATLERKVFGLWSAVRRNGADTRGGEGRRFGPWFVFRCFQTQLARPLIEYADH